MKKILIVLGLCLFSLQSFGVTKTYYFEAEHAQTQKKMYFLGTHHILPVSTLPFAVRKHIKNRYHVVTEKGKMGGRIKKVDSATINAWQTGNKLRFPTDTTNYFDSFTSNQKTNFLKVVAAVYPSLANGIASIKLSDFTMIGLFNLFYECLQDLGMDDGVCDMLNCTGLPALDDENCNVLEYIGKMQLAARKVSKINAYNAERTHAHGGNGLYDSMNEFLQNLEVGNIYYVSKFDPIAHSLNSPITFEEIYKNGFDETLMPEEYLENPMIKGRNQCWLPKIFDYNKSFKTDIFVVGVGHLFGDHGLLKMMQRKGFNINRATPECKFKPYLHALGAGGKPLLSLQEKATLLLKRSNSRKAKFKANVLRAKQRLLQLKDNVRYKLLKVEDEHWKAVYGPKESRKPKKVADLKLEKEKLKIKTIINQAEQRLKLATLKLKTAA